MFTLSLSRFLLAGGAASVLVAAMAGCSTESDAQQPDASSNAGQAQPAALEGVVLASKPANAISVVAARTNVEPGSTVTVQGRVGGQRDPFLEDRAGLQLVDPAAVAACDASPDDHCTAPWDFCCEDPGAVAAASSFVQVVGEDGEPVAASLKGVGGIQPGSFLVVQGTIDEGSSEEGLVINASGIYVDEDRQVVMLSEEKQSEHQHDHAGHDHDHDHDHDHQH